MDTLQLKDCCTCVVEKINSIFADYAMYREEDSLTIETS